MRIRRVLALIVLAAASTVALALPSVEAVQAEVQRGNYARAEAMMQEVVAAKPDSARAHYVYAEILAHDRRFEQAAAEAAKARQLDPAIAFTDPAKFNAFVQLLEREHAAIGARSAALGAAPAMAPRPAAQPAPGGAPAWVWVFGLAGIAAVVWVVVGRRQRAAAAPVVMGSGTAGPAPAGYGPGYGPAVGPVAPSAGSGLMGVGLAAAGGVAAGMLADRLLNSGRGTATALPAGSSPGALVPGMFDDTPPDDPAARDLEQRSIDFGQGGDGWDDAGSAGFDSGVAGGSDDGGGW